ncbi:uncharacterized protein BO97DRAFT_447317 [Aspergillus homomorphus CBS 101889]|uniref:ubiquitinyl hydrolase 1 n=1 Tax=Aspergillus homomorphus (strain CBS 101889) TaxID=1450537 RepID=A0A395HFT2_ASPHC|nr:hypothetical protein BO97DRAFT_447317 [Aspergillus homomorphus CBS 101889]RAL06801.1 hypothetical protein BO97DRAFT_447317 [Aspergillus homomorphus CBS 101889]
MFARELKFIFNHVVHPSMLPQHNDTEVNDLEGPMEQSLYQVALEALEGFVQACPPEFTGPWNTVINMLEHWKEIDKHETVCEDTLTCILSDLRKHGAVALYIRAQNCGFLAYFDRDRDRLIFDAFEASPRAADVLRAPGSLLRQFPGQSVEIPAAMTEKPDFCSWLAGQISRLFIETVNKMVPTTRKAGVQALELRDTVHPGMVTENIMIQLLAHGNHNSWPCFEKHMQDEVNWRSSKHPWRRSPLWFVMRVALQTVLRRTFTDIKGQTQYKNFMLYLIAEIAIKANHMPAALSADQLQIIRAKMARRITKLDSGVYDFVAQHVLSADIALKTRLAKVQMTIRRNDSVAIPHNIVCTQQDLQLTLPQSSTYLAAALSSGLAEEVTSQFDGHGQIRDSRDSRGLPIPRQDDLLSILDFDRWVEYDMGGWAESVPLSEDLISVLADRFGQYDRYGSQLFAGNPVAVSTMRLTQLELWVTIDRMCTVLCPLLKDYSPEIPAEFLEPLLLPQRGQMRRAQKIENYIRARHRDQNRGSIFRNPESENFAVSYYESSGRLAQLRQDIEQYAEGKVHEKRREWESKSSRYHMLQYQAGQLEHEMELNSRGRYNCVSTCRKCSFINQASSILIDIYEWPLPENESTIKTVLFELACPHWFVAWRDLTWKILQDFGRREVKRAQDMEQNLLNYGETHDFAVQWGQRLTLGSKTKSWRRTHYNPQPFPVDFEKINLPNPLQFKLLDSASDCNSWVTDQAKSSTLKPLCTLELPQGSYSHLQYAVDSFRHTQNEVLADQAHCHPTLSLHEFIAFGCLRAGERVQWLNILRELASPALSLNQESVGILIRQAAWELGTPGDRTELREAHRVFEDVSFSERLLETLEHRLDSIEANWNEHQTLQTLIVLGLRTLNLSRAGSVVERAAAFIRRGRRVTIRWIENLINALDSHFGVQSEAHQELLVRVGGICQLTYAVESDHVTTILRSSEDLFHLTRASIVVFENTPPELRCKMPAAAGWVRTSRILHHVETRTRQLVQQDASGFNQAVRNSVPNLAITNTWSFGNGNLTRWAVNQVAPDGTRQKRQVRYDLLSGELLVDNSPPGRLPESYRQDPSYKRIFGLRTLIVVPSNLPGCRFMSARPFEGYQVHFGQEEDRLLVKAEKAGQVLKFIPHDWLQGDFPQCLLTDYAHWLNLEDETLEFRPLAQAWQPDQRNWRLSTNFTDAEPAVMVRPRCTMIGVHSQLFSQLSNLLAALDRPDHMIVYQNSEGIVVVDMIRLRLRFLVNGDGLLESPELHAIVDRDQDIGCFYGLKNKLVLQDIKEKSQRSVLIPFGDAQLWKARHHSVVQIEPPEERRIRYFQYFLDRDMQELRGPSDMLGILYQAYMHALTGFVLADPSIQRPGTAEALRILRQARLRSPLPLEKESIKLLGRLAALTPRRTYYPSHLKTMQSVEWNSDLGELAQHDDFRALVQMIADHAQSFSMLHNVSTEDQEAYVNCYQDRGEPHLIERARFRNAQFYPAEFGGSIVRSAPTPSPYSARDRGSGSERSGRVYEVATLIRDWPKWVPQCSELYSTVSSWKHVQLAAMRVADLNYNELLELSFGDAWGALYELCRSPDRRQSSYSLMSLFCIIAFKGDEQLSNLRPLLSVAFSGQFADLPVPGYGERGPVLNLQRGEEPVPSEITALVSSHYAPFQNCSPLSNLSKTGGKEIQEDRERYSLEKEIYLTQCRDHVMEQWPCERPQLQGCSQLDYEGASKACALLCTQWYQNRTFLRFLREVQARLNTSGTEPLGPVRNVPPAPLHLNSARTTYCPPSLLGLIQSRDIMTTVPIPQPPPLKFSRHRLPTRHRSATTSKLLALVSEFRNNVDPDYREYGDGLQESLDALEISDLPCLPTSLPVPRDVLECECHMLERQTEDLWNCLYRALSATNRATEKIASGLLWPQINVLSILSLLVANQWQRVPELWKTPILSFAKCVATLRRCRRLLLFYDRVDIDGFFKEAEAAECEGWDAATRPEWLLLEIENNITIRACQAEVAQRIICPDPPGNSVLQLNMGEGKTSVITPMVAMVLADGSQVPQIIVLKPLFRQSLDILTQLLGRILGRPIYHVPFSRDTPLDKKMIKALRMIYEQCQKNQGVLIALPEHILSFRLVGLDLVYRKPNLAQKAIALEAWLQDNCRNIIDESDEILDPKFQLVYTVGNQQSLDGHSDRWQIVQGLLSVVEQQARELHVQDPASINFEYHGARYPVFHFLNADAVNVLVDMVLTSINEQGLPGLPLHLWARHIRHRAFNFIRFPDLTPLEVQVPRDTFGQGNVLRKLLALRGFLAHGILGFALAAKRWLVDYGLSPSRCMMAVPFRAKGVPSEHAEFGHPDVAIILTCLSYYYHGLSVEQVRHCFTLLGKENDPEAAYQDWIRRDVSTLPEELRALTSVNLEDTGAFLKILYPHLQHQKGLIDFYLSRVVFPREAKEFPHKLCTSAWDLPSKSDRPLTTGFSGTNDNRFLLPHSAPQHDLPELLHTNAMVLGHLLREENKRCILAQDTQGCQLQAEQLLDLISRQDPPIQVIIDVGAQILELSNRSVAQRWLSTTASANVEAAIFFDESDEVVVLDRGGHVERLVSSPFRQHMAKCLVFLDQQHSRGVDLKLPSHYRAAVTLGPRLAKDRLVQACNRMRGIGQGQSVTFVIPPCVSRNMSSQGTAITSLDVVRWALVQTCNVFKSLAPLWASQGLQYHKRQIAWDKLLRAESPPQEAIRHMQEPEARTLSQLYAPWNKPEASSVDEKLDTSNSAIQKLLNVWGNSGRGMQQGPGLHEEHERQISHEVQREQQSCRPPGLPAALHRVHDDVRYLVTHGTLPESSSTAVRPAFEIFRQTSAGQFDFPTSLAPRLFATEDFTCTVKQREQACTDDFLKPAHWVLANAYNQELLLLSQYEVNELFHLIRSSQKTRLLIYTPKTTKIMRSFDSLDFLQLGLGLTMPRQPQATAQDLGLFAGTLYFESFSIYESFRQFLGLVTDSYREIPEDQVTNEGYVDSDTRMAHNWPVNSPFRSCPLQFLGAVLDIRSKSHGYLQTHAGTIVETVPLSATYF